MSDDIYGMKPGRYYFCHVYKTIGEPMLKAIDIEKKIDEGQRVFDGFRIERKIPDSEYEAAMKKKTEMHYNDIFEKRGGEMGRKEKTPNCAICHWITYSTEDTAPNCVAQGYKFTTECYNTDQCHQLFEEHSIKSREER